MTTPTVSESAKDRAARLEARRQSSAAADGNDSESDIEVMSDVEISPLKVPPAMNAKTTPKTSGNPIIIVDDKTDKASEQFLGALTGAQELEIEEKYSIGLFKDFVKQRVSSELAENDPKRVRSEQEITDLLNAKGAFLSAQLTNFTPKLNFQLKGGIFAGAIIGGTLNVTDAEIGFIATAFPKLKAEHLVKIVPSLLKQRNLSISRMEDERYFRAASKKRAAPTETPSTPPPRKVARTGTPQIETTGGIIVTKPTPASPDRLDPFILISNTAARHVDVIREQRSKFANIKLVPLAAIDNKYHDRQRMRVAQMDNVVKAYDEALAAKDAYIKALRAGSASAPRNIGNKGGRGRRPRRN